MGLLDDPDPIVRAAAAQGLGTLEATDAVADLKPLLNDPAAEEFQSTPQS